MRGPNMSYCAVENTASAMEQVLDLMQDFDTVEDWLHSLNEYERASVHELLRACEDFTQVMHTDSLELAE